MTNQIDQLTRSFQFGFILRRNSNKIMMRFCVFKFESETDKRIPTFWPKFSWMVAFCQIWPIEWVGPCAFEIEFVLRVLNLAEIITNRRALAHKRTHVFANKFWIIYKLANNLHNIFDSFKVIQTTKLFIECEKPSMYRIHIKHHLNTQTLTQTQSRCCVVFFGFDFSLIFCC